MTQKKSSGWRTFVIITASLAVIVFYGIALTLFGMTLVSPVWIVSAAVVLAAVTALALWSRWQWLTRTQNVVVNVGCHLVAATGLFMAVILGVNYYGRHTGESYTVGAEIERVYAETRYRSKRVSRRHYTRGEPYKVYFMDVKLPDGRVRKRSISLRRYNRYAWSSHRRRPRPDSVSLTMTPGALGLTVMERDTEN